jgi:hypothetical protein
MIDNSKAKLRLTLIFHECPSFAFRFVPSRFSKSLVHLMVRKCRQRDLLKEIRYQNRKRIILVPNMEEIKHNRAQTQRSVCHGRCKDTRNWITVGTYVEKTRSHGFADRSRFDSRLQDNCQNVTFIPRKTSTWSNVGTTKVYVSYTPNTGS